jgi:membrane protein implicated in regulation of membrane protease activity
MIPITLGPILIYFFLARDMLARAADGRRLKCGLLLACIFLLGVFFAATSGGLHESTNYLDVRFCHDGSDPSPICQIIHVNDDYFAHYLYYLGVLFFNFTLLVLEWLRPSRVAARIRDLWWLGANAFFIAAGIFANLAFEEATLDLVFFSIVSVTSITLLLRRRHDWRQRPFTLYLASSYAVGTIAAMVYKLIAS